MQYGLNPIWFSQVALLWILSVLGIFNNSLHFYTYHSQCACAQGNVRTEWLKLELLPMKVDDGSALEKFFDLSRIFEEIFAKI